jgi:hypothetical protein
MIDLSEREIQEIAVLSAQRAQEIERLRSICRTIATGLRGQHASRLDMAKLADTADGPFV